MATDCGVMCMAQLRPPPLPWRQAKRGRLAGREWHGGGTAATVGETGETWDAGQPGAARGGTAVASAAATSPAVASPATGRGTGEAVGAASIVESC